MSFDHSDRKLPYLTHSCVLMGDPRSPSLFAALEEQGVLSLNNTDPEASTHPSQNLRLDPS